MAFGRGSATNATASPAVPAKPKAGRTRGRMKPPAQKATSKSTKAGRMRKAPTGTPLSPNC